MKLSKVLTQFNFPQEVKEHILGFGIENLYPPQEEAIQKGVLKGNSLLLSVPTAAGKTMIAELAMIKSLKESGGRCLYIVPLKALAREKHDDFKKKYSPLGIKIGVATGDRDSADRSLSRCHILIATAEKVDSLLRSRAQWLINGLNVIVIDEIHFINDGSRGPTLEILTARMRQINPKAQILALSATVSNALDMAKWLKAELVASDWRPIPLKEGVYHNQQIRFQNHGSRLILEEPPDDLSKLVIDTLKGNGQVLVFVNSRRSAQASSRQVCPSVWNTLKEEEKKKLIALSKEILGASSSATKICHKLAEVVARGAAFHHAGLKPRQRKLIEDNFKNNLIKVICSTPTLAAGVNLPARRAILRDFKRYEAGLGAAPIPVSEYKQCAGRAGRPQYDEYGEAVIMAKSYSESNAVMDRYINAKSEPIISKLGQESSLRIHILASIAGGYVHDVNETFEFISHTFLAHQRQSMNLINLITEIFEFLQSEGFVEKSGFRYFATPLGQCTSRLYIDPLTSIVLRDGLKKIESGFPFTPIGFLQLLCCCPDTPLTKYSKKTVEEIELFEERHQNQFLMTEKDILILEDYFSNLAIVNTTRLFTSWIDEEKEETLCDEFNVGPGDIYRHTESARWLMHAAVVIADLLEMNSITIPLANLKTRIQYGIKEEIIPLTRLKGIGRIRARILFQKGFKRLSDFKFTSADDLSGIKQIGKSLAKDILEQVKGKPHRRSLPALAEDPNEWE